MIEAVLFDLDGTLVDTNRAHVEAWIEVFREHGADRVPPERIAKEIGKGGELLVRSILGARAPKRVARRLAERESVLFRRIVRSRRMHAFAGAVALLDAVRARALASALATSSLKPMLAALFASVGTDLRRRVDAVVTADDVARAKPHPEPLYAAADKLGVDPRRCVMVGDTAHDVRAAERARIASIGLATGAWKSEELVAAGASSAWRDPRDLLEHLDRALERATRGATTRTPRVRRRDGA